MKIYKNLIPLFCLIIFNVNDVFGQVPIGHWTTHAPGAKVINVEKMHEKVFAATPYEIIYYNTGDNSINKLTKVNGLSDFGVSVMRYNPATDQIFVGYTNANIDIIDKNDNVTNINDIKIKDILADKHINDVYFIDELAYVCCGFGIVVVDLERMEVKDTYIIGRDGSYLNVNDITVYDGKFYAATSSGVYYADCDNENLADYSQWRRDNTMIHVSINYTEIETFNNYLIANYSENKYNADTLFLFDGEGWDYFPTNSYSIKRDIKAQDDKLLMTGHYSLRVLNRNLSINTDFYNDLEPFAATYDKKENVYWIGDRNNSLIKMYPDKTREDIIFNGPYNNTNFEIKAKGNQLWVAAGGYTSTWAKRWMSDGVYYYTDYEWTNINRRNNEAFDTINDFVTIAIDPIDESKVYVGSYHKGLLEFNDFELRKIYDHTNSSLDFLTGYDYIYVTGLDFDSKNNLWVANHGTDKMLSVKTTKDDWFSYNIGSHDISHLVVDENDYKWILTRNGTFIVFNENKTISDMSDDRSKIIGKTAGQGGLHSEATCMALDKNGTMWVGTNDGLALFYSTSKIFQQGANYDASRILVPRNDGTGQADYLLSGESVLSICVDDANNLWVGTKNGVFYISNNGLTEYHHFTEENSPLLSNTVQSIAIDEEGNVYFATDKGIISYKGIATESKKTNSDVVVYPNPVRQDYSGLIGIKNLVANSLVKITTVDGSFVTHLYSEGGQAAWDRTTINGDKVAPGVYLIFVSDESGKETFATKILIM